MYALSDHLFGWRRVLPLRDPAVLAAPDSRRRRLRAAGPAAARHPSPRVLRRGFSMTLVLVCWTLAMISGLYWARRWTRLLTGLTTLSFLGIAWAQRLAHHPTGSFLPGMPWPALVVLGLSPWPLAAQRERHERMLRDSHLREAQRCTTIAQMARTLLTLQHTSQQLEQEITALGDVYQVTKVTGRALHVHELFASLLELAPRLFEIQGLRLIDVSGHPPHVLRASRVADGRMMIAPNGREVAAAESHAMTQLQQTLAQHPATPHELHDVHVDGTRTTWAPLSKEQHLLGWLVAEGLPDTQRHTLAVVARQLSLQQARITLYQQVESLAITDPLTGLFVRRYFLDGAQEEVGRSSRHGLSCALLMVDLDRFKEKNDTYGHLVGDVVLREVAHLLRGNLREVDLIARYGGEEFILLLIETTAEQALLIARRLQQVVEVHRIRAYDELLQQTVSIGVAAFPDDAATVDALIERADSALYAAKRAGRNQAIRWSSAMGQQTMASAE